MDLFRRRRFGYFGRFLLMEKNMEISLLFDFYGQLLSEKQHEAVLLYVNDDLSLSEVATEMGITRQGVRDLVKRSEAELYEYERKLGLLRRFEEVEKSAQSILLLSAEVENSSDPQMKLLGSRIKQLAKALTEQEA